MPTITLKDAEIYYERHGQGPTLMLVPAGEAKEAREHAGDMQVVMVRNLDDALQALEAAGGAPVPPAPTTTTTVAPG